eukprot:g29.t1
MVFIDRLSKTFCAPIDPHSLAVFRIAFGVLMLIDALLERDVADLPRLFDDASQCSFPLFDDMPILSSTGFDLLVGAVLLSCAGIILGLFYRLSAFILAAAHWYIFFLDKRSWNNHSYLFATMLTMLVFVDAHEALSIDAVFVWPSDGNRCGKHRHIPAWHLIIFRWLAFLVYFIAGLKKLFDTDWVGGYSMNSFLTAGYNAWTLGLYGYSWDMMVHSFHYQHSKIEVKPQGGGGNAESLFLRPDVFVKDSPSKRWLYHPDMQKQFALCARRNVDVMADVRNASIYLDVWVSMNDRFQQRLVDPRIDIAAEPAQAFVVE